MFVGRDVELAGLERLYSTKGFQMVVVYGRRRIGKTTLIDEFVKGKKVFYFTAQQRSSALNLAAFSRVVYEYFNMPLSTPSFADWSTALEFIAESAKRDRIVFVFDELPYAARTEPSLPSALQVAIDHHFKSTNVFMVLCGSNEGFMESKVLGRKSPLYGRRTGQIHLSAFDYLDAAKMLGKMPETDLVQYYATFGGTPYYLSQVDSGASYEENVRSLMFEKIGLLYEEPLMLLRQELREPSLYNSILSAVAAGATEPANIASKAGVEANSVGKYLKTLMGLGLVERKVPYGENPTRSKRAIYVIVDPFFAFWYCFVEPNIGAVELGAGNAIAKQVCAGQALPTFVGKQFERVTLQWLARQNAAGALPFLATSFGSWWGTDHKAHETVDIDAIAANKVERSILFAECKWRNDFNETAAVEQLEHRADLVDTKMQRVYALVTKNPLHASTKRKLTERDDFIVACAKDLFR